MKCALCQADNAIVHLTQIVESGMTQIDLCGPCARAKGVHDPTGLSLADLLLSLGHGEKPAPGRPDAET